MAYQSIIQLRSLGYSSGEKCLLDCLNDAKDDLRKLMQCWDNRLTFERLSLIEAYCDSRLSIALELEFAGHPQYIQYSALSNSKSAILEDSPSCFSVNICQGGNGSNGQQQSVFIGNVETVQGTKRGIPSFVRLYDIKNERDDIGTRHLYFSALQSGFKFLFGIPNWEVCPLGWCSTAQGDNLTSHEVQGSPQVVDSIAKDQRNFFRKGFGHFKFEDIYPCVRVFLDVKTVKIGLDESIQEFVKLTDVLIGPFDL